MATAKLKKCAKQPQTLKPTRKRLKTTTEIKTTTEEHITTKKRHKIMEMRCEMTTEIQNDQKEGRKQMTIIKRHKMITERLGKTRKGLETMTTKHKSKRDINQP